MTELPDSEELLRDQYADASNLDARMRLHARFSTNKYGWLRWVFDRFDLPDCCRVLELGCGSGALWVGNRARIPPGWTVTLSDFSPGMVDEARKNLRDLGGDFSFEVIDARVIPLDGGSLDAVIANHMLYHVPDVDRTLAEICRVLRPGGRLYAATNGPGHMGELRRLVRSLAPELPFARDVNVRRRFALGNGEGRLRKHFSDVVVHRYEDALEVPTAEPLLAYVLSVRGAKDTFTDEMVSELRGMIDRQIASAGAFHVTKNSGMFTATRPA